LSVLTGFLLGSLNALWPWKDAVRELYTHSDGRVEYFRVNAPVGEDVGAIVALAVAGAALVLGLDRVGRKARSRRS
jgi:putative membrane protein